MHQISPLREVTSMPATIKYYADDAASFFATFYFIAAFYFILNMWMALASRQLSLLLHCLLEERSAKTVY